MRTPSLHVLTTSGYLLVILMKGWYERGDSNPYDHDDLRILSPLRLPIPPRSRRNVSSTT